MDDRKTIGPYELIEEIGRGGMSIVYKADHPTLSKKVAIKLLSPTLSLDPKFIERFKNEAKILSSFRHQNIVSIIDFGEDRQQYYIVMDYIEGYTVKQMLQQAGPISLKIALNVMKNISSAISYTHRKGIIHRDLKSSNIMMDHTGRILVTDFGLSKDISLKSIPETTLQSNDIAGTFGYIAPEQLDPKIGNIDERTDIYSLGVVFYEMVTGQLPFSEKNAPINLAYMHLSVIPESPLKIQKELLPKADQVIMRMLEKDPTKRFQSFEEVLAAVNEMEDIAQYYREGSEETAGSFFEIVTEEQSFTKSIEEFNKTFDKKTTEKKLPSDAVQDEKIIGNRYRIEKLILKRILSNLYLGTDLQQSCSVTIQIPNDTRPTFRSRLEREIDAMKQVDHPSFVKLLDVINENDTFYVIREHIEGKTIRNMIEDGSIPLMQSVDIIMHVLEGLKYLHSKGIIHRDINSDVVLITSEKKAMITTLGITRIEDASSVSSGEFLGIVQYTAPEQITQSKSDARSDIYAVGILLFELLTGKPPFTSSLPVDVMDMHLKKIPRFPDDMQNLIPLNLQRIVLKALAKIPDQRYQSVQEFQDELNRFKASFEEDAVSPVESADKEIASFFSTDEEDPSSIMYKNILETNKSPNKNVSFTIKKKPSNKDEKKKSRVNIDKLITDEIKPKEHITPKVDFQIKEPPLSRPKRRNTFLAPLFAFALVAVLVYLFYPLLPIEKLSFLNRFQLNEQINPTSTFFALSENQKTTFPSFESHEIIFQVKETVHQITYNQLPQEVYVQSALLDDDAFRVTLYSDMLTHKTPFVLQLTAWDENKQELFSSEFVLCIENKNLTMIRFYMGSPYYERITSQGIENKEFEVTPLMHNFNIYLPLRFIVDSFNGMLEYDFTQEMITVKNLGEETYRFFLYQNRYYVGDQSFAINPIFEKEDRAYLPILLFTQKKGLFAQLSPADEGKTLVTIMRLR